MEKINDIANWFLCKESMTHKKLQKLCYYATAWCYTLIDDFSVDTEFQAWRHGPVSPELYERFQGSGWTDLTSTEGKPALSPNVDEMLENVWFTYGDMSANALEGLSHEEWPWMEARKGCDPSEACQNIISPETMKTFYRSIYLAEGEA